MAEIPEYPSWVMKVDASFCDGIAGLGIDSDRHFVAAEVVRCITADEAEYLAILRAMEIAIRAKAPSPLILSDSESAVRRIEPEARACGFEVERRPRDQVRNAHIAARQVLQAWKAGRMHRPTWPGPLVPQWELRLAVQAGAR